MGHEEAWRLKYEVQAGLWIAQWTDEIAPILATVADLGFDRVEISLLGMTDDKAAALGRLNRDQRISAACSDGLSRAADITSQSAEIRQRCAAPTFLVLISSAVTFLVSFWNGDRLGRTYIAPYGGHWPDGGSGGSVRQKDLV